MPPLKILSIIGARPNFIKMAPLYRAFQKYPHFQIVLVHTGQHSGEHMSGVFFDQLELPVPDYQLDIPPATPTAQLARIMLALEPVLEKVQPDLVLVIGDVNSTLAAALTASKMGFPLAHVEAGLRSFDRSMPEELNRILTDQLADYLFVSEPSGMRHLMQEGIAAEKVFLTGNCLLDASMQFQAKGLELKVLEALQLEPRKYLLVTLHRPSNVDHPECLDQILTLLETISPQIRLLFPIHPRTRAHMERFGFAARLSQIQNLQLLEPQGYLEFQQLLANALGVVTDSGGVQEESTFLRVPCLTLRDNTERPITVEQGSNTLFSAADPARLLQKVQALLEGKYRPLDPPELWDGKAAERIAAIIDENCYRKR